MRFDRRQFLMAGGAAAVACSGSGDSDSDPGTPPPTPAPERAPTPAADVPPLPLETAVFPVGVQVGEPVAGAAIVLVRTTEPSVDVVWRRHDGQGWVDGGRVDAVDTSAGFARVELTGLTPDSAFTIWAATSTGSSRPTLFRTAPDTSRTIRIGATSCLGESNPALGNLAFVGPRDVDVMLLLGDTVYADGSVTREDYQAIWDAQFERVALRDMFASAAVIATWDDHEVANNWTLGEGSALEDEVTPEQLQIAIEVWRERVPMSVGAAGSGIWRQVSWGPDVDLFLLDCRGERSEGKIVSDAQLTWVTQGLRASTARFKLVIASVHVTDHFELLGVIADTDRWQGYPSQRAELLLAASEVPGVLFITGDMHFGAVQRVDPEGGVGAGLVEIAAGPSGSRLFPILDVAELAGGPPAQYLTLLDTWSWSEIELDPGTGSVLVRFVGDDGSVLAEQTLSV